LTKFIFRIPKIPKFGGQESISDASMRAALEREAENADIYLQRCYHHVE
jgi:hypothetical protein